MLSNVSPKSNANCSAFCEALYKAPVIASAASFELCTNTPADKAKL